MKEVKKIAAQGDCLFLKVAKLPGGLVRQETGPLIIAHSETGHHHAVDATDGVALFTDPKDPLVCYLQLSGIEYADVVHHRAWDTHDTVRLLSGAKKKAVFKVHRQQEYTPEGWRSVQD